MLVFERDLYLHVFRKNKVSWGCLKSPLQLLGGLTHYSVQILDQEVLNPKKEKGSEQLFTVCNQQDSLSIHFSAVDHPQ